MERRRLRAMTQPRIRSLLLALVLTLPLAGCLGDGAQADPPKENVEPTPTTPTSTPPSDAFLVEELRVAPQDDGVRPLREDDEIFVRFTLRHPGTPDEAVTRFVTIAVDREVVDVQQIRLEPGATRDIEVPLGFARGRESVQAEVRIAPTVARVEVDVTPWPRTGENVEVGSLTFRVDRWLRDDETGGTRVNLTVKRSADPDTHLSDRWARLLCADEHGRVSLHGEVRILLPGPGEQGTQDLNLPGCEHTIYGVHLEGQEGGEPLSDRILFVKRAWMPPAA